MGITGCSEVLLFALELASIMNMNQLSDSAVVQAQRIAIATLLSFAYESGRCDALLHQELEEWEDEEVSGEIPTAELPDCDALALLVAGEAAAATVLGAPSEETAPESLGEQAKAVAFQAIADGWHATRR